MSLSNIVKSIQDIMRKDAGVDGEALSCHCINIIRC